MERINQNVNTLYTEYINTNIQKNYNKYKEIYMN
jgi:hypothetical protein